MSSQVKLLPHIKRSDPEKEFELLKQIGSGTYGEVYKVSTWSHTHHACMFLSLSK